MIKTIGIIGPNAFQCSKELFDFGVELGKSLGIYSCAVICGGMGGFMEAVCKGVKSSNSHFPLQTIGILPDSTSEKANSYIDICIPTGMGIARNAIIINSSDILIAAGGGSGTLSELAFAWQQNKKVLCITSFEGWSAKLAGQDLDQRHQNLLIPVANLEEIHAELKKLL